MFPHLFLKLFQLFVGIDNVFAFVGASRLFALRSNGFRFTVLGNLKGFRYFRDDFARRRSGVGLNSRC